MDSNVKRYLGRGWKFPVRVDKQTGRIVMSEQEEDIAEAVKIILLTRKGERAMQPEFGSNAYKFVFGSMQVTSVKMIEEEIKESLVQWEPRIKDIEVSSRFDPGNPNKLFLNISYTVRSTNNPFNLVFPFYINEGIG